MKKKDLPHQFLASMKELLGSGDGYDAFLDSFERPRRAGLRLNRMKISEEDFEKNPPFGVRKIPWVSGGYFCSPEETRPSGHPWYRAGLYYLQEPSAMTPADRLPVRPGDRVLDLCAAPGGKATQLAGKLFGKDTRISGQTGETPEAGKISAEPSGHAGGIRKASSRGERGTAVLVANEINTSRARALLRNLEMAGAVNYMVTNEDAAKLSDAFPEYFDKILLDAPCSGEGMFRKNPDAVRLWSPEKVRECAKVQKSLLDEAYKMLRPGGLLMYSTCTFSADEDEQAVSYMLREHPDVSLVDIESYEGFSEGIPGAADGNPELKKCVRIWPHRMEGEGHFLAMMQKAFPRDDADRPVGEAETVMIPAEEFSGGDRIPNREDFETGRQEPERSQIRGSRTKHSGRRKDSFRQSQGNMKKNRKDAKKDSDEGIGPSYFYRFLEESGITLPAGRIDRRGDRMYLISEELEEPRGLKFLRNGVYLGDLKKKRFEPSQPLALILSEKNCRASVSFHADSGSLREYLEGTPIDLGQVENVADVSGEDLKNGCWYLVCVDGRGIGWGKYAGHVLKNKIPQSWR